MSALALTTSWLRAPEGEIKDEVPSPSTDAGDEPSPFEQVWAGLALGLDPRPQERPAPANLEGAESGARELPGSADGWRRSLDGLVLGHASSALSVVSEGAVVPGMNSSGSPWSPAAVEVAAVEVAAVEVAAERVNIDLPGTISASSPASNEADSRSTEAFFQTNGPSPVGDGATNPRMGVPDLSARSSTSALRAPIPRATSPWTSESAAAPSAPMGHASVALRVNDASIAEAAGDPRHAPNFTAMDRSTMGVSSSLAPMANRPNRGASAATPETSLMMTSPMMTPPMMTPPAGVTRDAEPPNRDARALLASRGGSASARDESISVGEPSPADAIAGPGSLDADVGSALREAEETRVHRTGLEGPIGASGTLEVLSRALPGGFSGAFIERSALGHRGRGTAHEDESRERVSRPTDLAIAASTTPRDAVIRDGLEFGHAISSHVTRQSREALRATGDESFTPSSRDPRGAEVESPPERRTSEHRTEHWSSTEGRPEAAISTDGGARSDTSRERSSGERFPAALRADEEGTPQADMAGSAEMGRDRLTLDGAERSRVREAADDEAVAIAGSGGGETIAREPVAESPGEPLEVARRSNAERLEAAELHAARSAVKQGVTAVTSIPELGRLWIDARGDGPTVDVRIVAEDARVAEAVSASRVEMRGDLRASDIALGDFSVRTGSSFAGGSANGHGSAPRDRGREAPEFSEELPRSTEPSAPMVGRARRVRIIL